MRGTAQTLLGLLAALLLDVPVLAKDGWGGRYTHNAVWEGRYTSNTVCGLEGSTVELQCTFRHPSTDKGQDIYTTETWWHNETRWSHGKPKDLRLDPRYSGRLRLDCHGNECKLFIRELRQSDAGEYIFRFVTSRGRGFSVRPGVTLSVTDLSVKARSSRLKCESTCPLGASASFIWYENGEKINGASTQFYYYSSSPNSYACALRDYEQLASPPVYALAAPSVSQSPSGDISKGQRLTLTCTVNPSASCTYWWFKVTGNSGHQYVGNGAVLVFPSIKSSDSAQYFCTVANELGEKQSERIKVNVKYPPEDVALKAIPSAVPLEGQSVNLKCSSNANPKARHMFYKDDKPVGREPREFFNFSSISPEDAGSFHCQACNKYGCVNSKKVLLDVVYGPRPPKVSAAPSGSVGVGSWVSLSCSSDANPSASYIWYRENSRVSDMAVFNISDYRAELHGEYRCQAWNGMGSQNATLRLSTKASPLKVMTVVCVLAGLLLLFLILVAALLLRKKMAPAAQPNASAEGSGGGPDELVYSTLAFSEPDAIYSNVARAERRQSEDRDEGVEYSAVNCRASRPRPEAGADANVCGALYSTVQLNRI